VVSLTVLVVDFSGVDSDASSPFLSKLQLELSFDHQVDLMVQYFPFCVKTSFFTKFS
jgi:hypothetical protein